MPSSSTPLRQEISFLNQFFEVAAFPEPYYNPANLEKAATGVKQKEFIERIGKSRIAQPRTGDPRSCHSPDDPPIAHYRGGWAGGDLLIRAARVGDPWPG